MLEGRFELTCRLKDCEQPSAVMSAPRVGELRFPTGLGSPSVLLGFIKTTLGEI